MVEPAPRRSLGIGVIGLGWMGQLHARSYRRVVEHSPQLRIAPSMVIAADPAATNRKVAADQLGFDRTTSDYQQVLDHPGVDVVSICAPNYLHRPIALAAARAGKPFWIEKPMGVDVADSAAIARAAVAAGVPTGVGFNYRHAPAVAHARNLVRSGGLGRVTNARCWLLADYAADPHGPLTWRYDRERAGSGVIGDLLTHGVDLLQFLLGRMSQVSAQTSTFIDERPIPTTIGVGHSGYEIGAETGPVGNEDYAAALARFDSGAVATLECSRVANGPRSEYAVEVYGTDGSLRWNFERLNELQLSQGRGSDAHGYTTVLVGPEHGDFGRFQPGAGTSMGFDDLKVIEAGLFVESVFTAQQRAPSAADGWAAAAVADAMVASAAHGTWQDVPPVEGATTYDA